MDRASFIVWLIRVVFSAVLLVSSCRTVWLALLRLMSIV